MNLRSLLAPFALFASPSACDRPAPVLRASVARPPAPRPSPHEDAVAHLVGVWLGDTAHSPFGPFPLALAFDRGADGAVHSRLVGHGGMYVDFRFHRDGDTWLLTEEGYLPDLGTQTHTLVPVAGGPGARWVDRDDAGALQVDVVVDRQTVRMDTRLHGEDHARFVMRRVEGEEAEQVRAAIARSRPAAGGDAVSSPR
jgi:hypothetical protein